MARFPSWVGAGGCHPKGPALGYLDGEPAKAVLEVQRSLVSAEGKGVLGAQPVKLLLVVDHKNLPENTAVRAQKSFPIGQGWLQEQTASQWGGVSGLSHCPRLSRNEYVRNETIHPDLTYLNVF